MTRFTIRPATINDLLAITFIYNQAILSTTATFDTEVKTTEDQLDWFKQHGAKYPLIVAESNSNIVGWAALSPWSDRCAYINTAEISLYIDEHFRGRGIGRSLTESIIDAGQKTGLHTLIARITEGNEASFHIAKTLGFEHIGVMREVGYKFGKLLDVYLMQKIYNGATD